MVDIILYKCVYEWVSGNDNSLLTINVKPSKCIGHQYVLVKLKAQHTAHYSMKLNAEST